VRAAPALLLALIACSGRDANSLGATVPPPLAVADSLRLEGRFADALPVYRAVRDSLESSPDTVLRWRTQIGWAEMMLRTGRLDSARAALDDARTMAGGDRAREARTHYVRTLLLHRQGKLDSALVEAGAALAGGRAVGDEELVVDAHSLHGTVHSLSGRYRLAAVHAESALAGERLLDRPRQFLATRLNNLGVEYRHLARLTDAERVLLEGLEVAQALPSPRVGMLLAGNMSNLRRSTGQLGDALRFAERSTAAAEALRDVQGAIVGNDDIGLVHLATGNIAGARAAFERSLAANTPMRYAYGSIVARLGLGHVALEEGEPATAAGHLRIAMTLADSGGFGQQRVVARTRLSTASLARSDGAAALQWANAAVGLSDSVGDLEARLEALAARAAALESLGRSGPAADGFLEAIDLLESRRGRIALGDLRMGVAEPYWHVYEGAIRTLLARDDATGAFAVAERAKARMLLELMAERDASRAQASPVNAAKERLRLLAEERAGARGAARQAEIDREIAVASESLAVLERAGRESGAAGAARYPVPAPLDSLSAGLIAPGQALVAYFWGERAVYGWRVAGDGVRARRLGGVDSVGAQVAFLRAALESPTGVDWAGPARRAWRTLLEPLIGDTPGLAGLLVIPDGPLGHLPFEALMRPAERTPLGATTTVAYGPSASVLLALAKRDAEAAWPRTLLAVGNPVAAGLPHAESEARAVFRMFEPASADLLVGRQATRERWLSLEPARYRYLHIAAHAEVNDRRPGETRVLMSGGALDLAAIRALRLRADLVTLSACETALGQRVRGEGVIGLPHAFLAAGAHAVIVTLWRIDDRATARFMEEFYDELLGGSAPAVALQSVRRRWVERQPREHPAFWAPFVLVGG
jgi:CHAT domain-containing protein